MEEFRNSQSFFGLFKFKSSSKFCGCCYIDTFALVIGLLNIILDVPLAYMSIAAIIDGYDHEDEKNAKFIHVMMSISLVYWCLHAISSFFFMVGLRDVS